MLLKCWVEFTSVWRAVQQCIYGDCNGSVWERHAREAAKKGTISSQLVKLAHRDVTDSGLPSAWLARKKKKKH